MAIGLRKAERARVRDENLDLLLSAARKDSTANGLRPLLRKAAKAVGTFGPLLGVAQIMGAAGLSDNFSWRERTLSSTMDESGKLPSMLFTSGAAWAGVATLVEAHLLRKSDSGELSIVGKVGVAAATVTGVSLIGTGATRGRLRRAHTPFAVACFISGPAITIFGGIDMIINGSKVGGAAAFAAGAFATTVAIKNVESGGKLAAMSEAKHAVAVSAGGMMIGVVRLLRTNGAAGNQAVERAAA